VPLAPLTTLGVGGAARHFISATSTTAVRDAHAWACDRQLPVFVLGGGSNVVVADTGVAGLVLRVDLRGCEIGRQRDEVSIEAEAGEPWDAVVEMSVAEGLAGVECLSGIPGSVGGTPVQNVGAYGQEVSSSIDRVTAFDRRSLGMIDLTASECGFAYRQSRFKQQDAGRFIICGVSFRLHAGPPTVTYPDVIAWAERHRLHRPGVADIRRAILDIRRGKGMVIDHADPDTRSVGSFFMNPVVSEPAHAEIERRAGRPAPAFPMKSGGVKVPAAWLIEQSGYTKGYAAGRAGLSSKHPLAIVNRGGATAREIVNLAAAVKRGVLDRFGVSLRPEPIFVGWDDDPLVEFLQKAPSTMLGAP
jgi:UDP-N-acetylmuramate dehydrogenase